MGKRKQRPISSGKACNRCAQRVTIRYRIQCDESGEWRLVCRDCWPQLSEGNAHYRYGGTWKAR